MAQEGVSPISATAILLVRPLFLYPIRDGVSMTAEDSSYSAYRIKVRTREFHGSLFDVEWDLTPSMVSLLFVFECV